jgi:hypothetical protein
LFLVKLTLFIELLKSILLRLDDQNLLLQNHTAIMVVLDCTKVAPKSYKYVEINIPGDKTLSRHYELNAASDPTTAFEIANDGAKVAVKGVEVTSDKSKSSYQLKSLEIDVRKGGRYRVTFDIELVQGGMALGVLDVDRQLWIFQIPLMRGQLGEQSFEFSAPGKQCQMVLQTDNAKPEVSIAYLRRLTVDDAQA